MNRKEEKLAMKKMLVLDLDGTSITNTYNITDELQQTIHFIMKKHMDLYCNRSFRIRCLYVL